MSSWNTIEPSAVLEEFTPAERAQLANIQGGADNLTAILARVVKKVRGDCLRGGNRIGPADTIPDSISEDVIAYARWRWLVSIPQAKAMQTPERKALYDDARDVFADIASGDPKVELPEASETLDVNTPGNAVEIATQPDPSRGANRKKMDGLV